MKRISTLFLLVFSLLNAEENNSSKETKEYIHALRITKYILNAHTYKKVVFGEDIVLKNHRVTVDICNKEKCTVTGTRGDSGETLTITYTADKAEKEGYNTKIPLKDLLFERAMLELADLLFPDVYLKSLYE